MRKLLIAAILLLFPGSITAAPPPPEIAKTVTFVFLADAAGNPQIRDGTPVANGTGFFVIVPNDAGAGGWVYFVTAKHVLKDEHGNFQRRVFLRINDKNSGSGFVMLDLVLTGAEQNVFFHSDPTVDIAVIPGLPDEGRFDFLALPVGMIKTKDEFKKSTIRPGSDVFFAGLFASHYGEKRNTPIFRFGRVAMLTDDRVRWQEAGKPLEMVELFLLETMSFGGNSGSPVFFSQGMDRQPGSIVIGSDEITLAGVMRGNFNESRIWELRQTPNAVVPTYAQNIGIAAVTPGYLLREILDSDALKEQRAANPIKAPTAPAQ